MGFFCDRCGVTGTGSDQVEITRVDRAAAASAAGVKENKRRATAMLKREGFPSTWLRDLGDRVVAVLTARDSVAKGARCTWRSGVILRDTHGDCVAIESIEVGYACWVDPLANTIEG